MVTSRPDPADIFTEMVSGYADGNYDKLSNSINTYFQSVSADLPPIRPDNRYSNHQEVVEEEPLVTVPEVERPNSWS